MRLNNQRGFGLLQVMVLSAVSVVIILQVGSVLQGLQSSAANLNGTAGAQSLTSTLPQLTSQTQCQTYLTSTAFSMAQATSPQGFPMAFSTHDTITNTNIADPNGGSLAL